MYYLGFFCWQKNLHWVCFHIFIKPKNLTKEDFMQCVPIGHGNLVPANVEFTAYYNENSAEFTPNRTYLFFRSDCSGFLQHEVENKVAGCSNYVQIKHFTFKGGRYTLISADQKCHNVFMEIAKTHLVNVWPIHTGRF